MLRDVALACAIGLWAAPVVANELQLEPPNMSARADRCTPRERATCDAAGGGRAIDYSLSCDACSAGAPAMPAEIVAPSPGDTPRPARVKRGPDCEPRSNSPNDACATLPPLDSLPRP